MFLFPIGVFQGYLLREAETTHDSGYLGEYRSGPQAHRSSFVVHNETEQ